MIYYARRICGIHLRIVFSLTIYSSIYLVNVNCVGPQTLQFGHFDIDDSSLFSVQWTGSQHQQIDTHHMQRLQSLQSVVLTTSKQEQYQCYFPQVKKQSSKADEEEANKKLNPYTLMKKDMEDSNFTPCSYRLEHYWTYELCHGRHMRQYHEDRQDAKNPKLHEYMLGVFDKAATVQAEKHYDDNYRKFKIPTKRLEGKDYPYLLFNMTNGTVCDLNNKPRKTGVLYVCHDKGRNNLYSFHETSTCEYEVVILSATLCKHPLFRLKSPDKNNIECYSMANSPRVPRKLHILEVESAKQFLSSSRPKLIVGSKEEMEEIQEETSQPSQPSKESKGFTSGEGKPQRVPSVPPVDAKLIEDFLSGEYCLSGGGTTWWKYRICLGKKVEQYHRDKLGNKETVIVLGKWNPQANDQWLNHKSKFKLPENEVHYLYTDGDMCQQINTFRQVEVRLKCLKGSSHVSTVTMSLFEPTTCKYILKVESPIVCSLVKGKGDDTQHV